MADVEGIEGSFGGAFLARPCLATLALAGRGGRAAYAGTAGGGANSSEARPGYSIRR